ncbi:ABC transporter permease subunit [Paenisporosarcina cavernae]|uniref:Multidrug ABC transporter permease n=1 Tax=Paenisporosarcina cavernae TaxID=2320858 RepID=A0A385YXW5_9BACL|nr:ABC transporter permease subunit [Paenisporosarcina cavernae]AYC30438.1 multidrug ABC transporter permease [Paenisporosarcina cavernae]
MVFKREWKRAQKSLWLWAISLGAMCVLILSVYPQFAANKAQLEELIQLYPEAMLKAFNIESLGFETALGFYGIEGYMFVTLFGSIFASLLGGNMLVKEESDKTIEFLLAKPISRSSIVAQKAAAIGVVILCFNVFLTVVMAIGFELAEESAFRTTEFWLLMFAPFLLHLTFAYLAFGISSFFRKQRQTTAMVLAIVLGTYFLNIAASISESLEKLAYLSPFFYVDASTILANETFRWEYILVLVVVSVVGILLARWQFMRKDIVV